MGVKSSSSFRWIYSRRKTTLYWLPEHSDRKTAYRRSSQQGRFARHFLSVARFYLAGDTVYGNSSITHEQAIDYLSQINDLPKSTSEHSELDDNAKEHLRDLGYLE